MPKCYYLEGLNPRDTDEKIIDGLKFYIPDLARWSQTYSIEATDTEEKTTERPGQREATITNQTPPILTHRIPIQSSSVDAPSARTPKAMPEHYTRRSAGPSQARADPQGRLAQFRPPEFGEILRDQAAN